MDNLVTLSNRTMTAMESVYRILDYLTDHFCEKTPELTFKKVGISDEQRDNILIWMQQEGLIKGLEYGRLVNGSFLVASFRDMAITIKGMEWREKYSRYYGD